MSIVRDDPNVRTDPALRRATEAKDGLRVGHIILATGAVVLLRRWYPQEAAAILGLTGLIIAAPGVTVLQHDETRERFLSLGLLLCWAGVCVGWPWGGTITGWAPVALVAIWLATVVGWSIARRRLARRWGWAKVLLDAHVAARRRRRIQHPIEARREMAKPDGTVRTRERSTEDLLARLNRRIEGAWVDYLEIVPWPPGTILLEPPAMRDQGLRWTVEIPEVSREVPVERIKRQHVHIFTALRPEQVRVEHLQGRTWALQEMTFTPFHTIPPRPPITPGLLYLGYSPMLRQLAVGMDTDGAQHLGIFGTSGSGKTDGLRWIADQYIAQGASWIVCDPKGDLGDFADGALIYARTMPDIEAALAEAKRLMHDRLVGLGPRQLYDGNRLIIIGDELARWSPTAADYVAPLTGLGRAARMPVLLSTQSPRVDNVGGGEVLANLPTRIVFRTANRTENTLALDSFASDFASHSLPADQPGRCIIMRVPGIEATEARTWLLPLAEANQIRIGASGRSPGGPLSGVSPPDQPGSARISHLKSVPDHPGSAPNPAGPPEGGPLDLNERQTVLYRELSRHEGVVAVADLRAALTAVLDQRQVSSVLDQLVRKRLVERVGHGRYRRTGPPLR